MPTRMLHEKICVSVTLAELTAEEERFFYRLLVQCDDHGRFHAHPAILLGKCFSVQVETITAAEVRSWRDRLVDAGLLEVYVVDGREYLRVLTWDTYQRKRDSKPKFPGPRDSAVNGTYSPQLAADCGSRVVKTGSREPGADIPGADTREPEAGARAPGGDSPRLPPPAPPVADSDGDVSSTTEAPETLVPNAANYAVGAELGMSLAQVDAQAVLMLAKYRRLRERRADWHSTLGGWLKNAPSFDQQRAPPDRNGHANPAPRSTVSNAPVSYLEVDEDAT